MHRVDYLKEIFKQPKTVAIPAITETVIVSLISISPLIFEAIRFFITSTTPLPISIPIQTYFLKGQLLFYAMGTIATIFWHAQQEYKNFLPLRIFFSLYCFIGGLVCTFAIGLDPKLNNINNDLIINLSISIYLTSLLFYAIISMISKINIDFRKYNSNQQKDFSDELKKSRGIS